ncbi:MAG: biopolymer transporter ExbD [Wenzhouxiangella sp.]|nr:MAG: biopolymer transporter ExbD [Wenzhouxiangella sp.]
MARRFQTTNRLSALTEINVTPLLDMAFALLIIFMITTPLLEQTIDIDLPVETQHTQPDRPAQYHVIAIDHHGDYFWDDEAVSPELLGVLLDRLAAEPDPPLLSIRADAGLPYQEVITLLDSIRRRGLTRINLETRVE